MIRRIHEQDINDPVHFDHVWRMENVHRYDHVRLREFTKHMRDGMVALDVGAGWCGWAEYAIANRMPGTYKAIDFSPEARNRTMTTLGMDAEQLEYRIGSALELPWPDGTFDLVGCGELIEHMEEPQLLVNELARVCKPGGRIVISTVNAYCPDAIRHGDYPEHIWAWDAADELLPYFAPLCTWARAYEVGDYFMVEAIK